MKRPPMPGAPMACLIVARAVSQQLQQSLGQGIPP